MAARKTRRLLIIEDHPAFAGAMETILGRSPHIDAVAVARSIAEGRELAFGSPGFDLIMVDLRLKDGESTGLIGEIKEVMPEIPVLVMSNAMDLSPAFQAGADAALHKDVPLTELLQTVERLVGWADRS